MHPPQAAKKKTVMKLRSRASKPPAVDKPAETFALSQTQLNSILEKLVKPNDKKIILENRGVGASKPVSSTSERISNQPKTTERISNQPKTMGKHEQTHKRNTKSINEVKVSSAHVDKPAIDVPTRLHGGGGDVAVDGPPPASRTLAGPTTIPSGPSAAPTAPQSDYTPPAKPLTNLERKKLQWKREKDEEANIEQFNPWGRPGAGAPIKDMHGEDINDYLIRKAPAESLQASVENATSSIQASSATKASHKENHMFMESLEIAEAKEQEVQKLNTINNPATVEHAAMRTNFNFGNKKGNEMYVDENLRKKKEWLDDLAKQREEQRVLKQKEDKRRNTSDGIWEDLHVENRHINYNKNQTRPIEAANTNNNNNNANNANPTTTTSANTNMYEDHRSTSAPNAAADVETSPPKPQKTPNAQYESPPFVQGQNTGDPAIVSPRYGSTFLRGQNAIVDDQTRDEMEMKRKRHILHQQCILEQVKEKERLKQIDRQRKIKEELAEEKKLKGQLDRMQNQNDQEMKNKFQKQEDEQKKMDILQQAFAKSQIDAEREKQEKRLQRLHNGGHDTSRLQSHYQDPELLSTKSPSNQNKALCKDQYTAPATTTITNTNTSDIATTGDHESSHYLDHKSDNIRNKAFQTCSTQTQIEPEHVPTVIPKLDLSIEYRAEEHSHVAPAPHGVPNTRQKPGCHDNARAKLDSELVKDEANPIVEVGKPIKISERPQWGVKVNDKQVKTKTQVNIANKRKKEKRLEERRQKIERERQLQTAKLEARNRAADEKKKLARQTRLLHLQHAAAAATAAADQNRNAHARRHTHNGGEGVTVATKNAGQDVQPAAGVNANTATVSRRDEDSHTAPLATATTPAPAPNSHRHQHQQQHQQQQRNQLTDRSNRTNRNHSPTKQISKSPIKERPLSPPLPTHRHQHNRTAYRDRPIVTPPFDDSFVPFIRSSMVLEPQNANIPLVQSREASASIRGRQAYAHENAPGRYGEKLPNRTDSRIDSNTGKLTKVPVIDAHLQAQDQPTGRQDRILQQLGDLRKGLIMKQKELEMGFNVMPHQYDLLK